MSGMETGKAPEMDYRFSLANERTFLAWIRTALALVAGGVAAAKALHFDHDLLRWIVAVPPILAGAVLAFDARRRWRHYEDAMLAHRPLPDADRGIKLIGAGLAVYAIVALVVSAIDG
jgi:putative membrane protein